MDTDIKPFSDHSARHERLLPYDLGSTAILADRNRSDSCRAVTGSTLVYPVAGQPTIPMIESEALALVKEYAAVEIGGG